jgi:flagellar hook protein FlgE
MPIPSLNISAVAMTTLQKAVDVVANNIANVSTTAYKSSRIYFSQESSNLISSGSSPSGTFAGTNPVEIGSGIKVSDVTTSFTQEVGPMKNTGMATDLAIAGLGTAFFVVSSQTPNNSTGITAPQFTRDGHFKLDSDKSLSNSSGDKVMGAMLYDDTTGKIKTLSGYSAVTFFSDQEIGSILPTDGVEYPIPTPDLNNITGPSPVFNHSKLIEMSVRGTLVQSGTEVNDVTKGDLTVSSIQLAEQADSRMIFTFNKDAIDPATPASTFTAQIDTNQVIQNNVLTLNLTNNSGEILQLRIRVQPGVTSLDQVFQNIEYDTVSQQSDTMIFRGSTAQGGSDLTVADNDFQYMTVSDLRSIMSPVKIPNFFYTQDPSVEVEATNFKIQANGTVSVRGPRSEEISLGRILIANFVNPDGLLSQGNNNYEETSNSGGAAISVVGGPFDKNAPSISNVQIVSGALEQSNVNLANEFAELIGFQRSLQANSRVITAADEILQTLINL